MKKAILYTIIVLTSFVMLGCAYEEGHRHHGDREYKEYKYRSPDGGWRGHDFEQHYYYDEHK